MADDQLRRRMTAADASFLYLERPGAALHIGSTSLLDAALPREELVRHMEGRMHRLPRYRQRAAFDPFNIAHPLWEDDPGFDVSRHIDEITLPPGAGDRELRQAIADQFAIILPRDRPLWKMVVIHGLPEGRSAVMSLVHHCMVDGVSGIELLTIVTDLKAEAEPEEPRPYVPATPPDPAQRLRDAWGDAVQQAMQAAADSFRRSLDPQRQLDEFRVMSRALATAAPAMLQPAPATPWNRPVGARRSHGVMPMAFAELRQLRAVLGGTINDLVLTVLSGGLGNYLRHAGLRTEGVELRAMVPVNVRNESDKTALGNQVSMMLAPLPVGMTDAGERHRRVCARMNELKEANQAGGFAIMSRQTESMPAQSQAIAGYFAPQTNPLFNIVCTNVPGPQVPLYMVGRKVETLWPLVPLSMGLGLGCALTSYNGTLYWGLCADPELIPDIDAVVQCIEDAFEGLKHEAVIVGAAQQVERESKASPPPAPLRLAPQRPATATVPKGYCMKCRASREMLNAAPVTMKNGKPATEGKCGVCGTRMFKIGAALGASAQEAPREAAPAAAPATLAAPPRLAPQRAAATATATVPKGYCMKCRASREMLNAAPVTMKNGKPATEGKCGVCGTRMFKIGAAATASGAAR